LSETFITRFVALDDLPQLISLYELLSSNDLPIDLASAQHHLAQLTAIPNCHIFGGWVDGTLVSSCTQFILPNLTRQGRPYALIENVVTDQAHRQQGFAKQLLNAATAYAFDHECYKVMLMTGMSDEGTLAFYKSAGFEQTKTGFQIRNIPARGQS
jgi:GNAT superfamily N-acetyltransferase